jgi:nucleotide sugar dehydrogenase
MLTQVIGLGVVGKAQAFLLNSLGYRVCGYDVEKVPKTGYYETVEQPVKADVTFICVPEKFVDRAIKQLIDAGNDWLVIKSTTPPGTVAELAGKYGIHLCHNPEFLREKHAFDDVLNPSRVVIGQCCPRHGSVLIDIYRRINAPIYVTDTTTSEMVKIASNTLRAFNITFWNNIFDLAQALSVNVQDVADLADPVRVLGEWEGGGWGTKAFGKPYDGKCLPKDMNILAEALKSRGLDASVVDAIQSYNEKLKRN